MAGLGEAVKRTEEALEAARAAAAHNSDRTIDVLLTRALVAALREASVRVTIALRETRR